MLNAPTRKYGYVEKYELDQIRVYRSVNLDERGVMIELAGQGCRQFEAVLEMQQKSWFSFLEFVLHQNGKVTRLDIAIDDIEGYIDIPDALEFTHKGYVQSKFNTYDFNGQGNIASGEHEGVTIYYGSKKSNVYFTFYQKNYEQAKKHKIPVENIGLWNRYEVRLIDEKAMLAVKELLNQQEISFVGRGILKEYLQFVYLDTIRGQKKKLRKLVDGWHQLVDDVDQLKLKVTPNKDFYTRSENWLRSQAGATIRMVQIADDTLGRDSTIEDIINRSDLSPKQQHMLQVFTTNFQDFISEKSAKNQEMI
ncbi:replication initiation factor [Listeria floridensis FSL S10-1187]|uniref:Replication initiation factor n=1 Tax=Listeria floridensis FSL S10-1187 TaxID=1265817 RepID=A0ABP3AZT0_9LIST|nr:replication initiation factor domain-containing protein [Listeria floridensis]EUJ33134.1 replication initiation factor [Listeria floridensis FSL S10-1187]